MSGKRVIIMDKIIVSGMQEIYCFSYFEMGSSRKENKVVNVIGDRIF